MAELLIVFKDGEYPPTGPPRPAYSSAIATLGLLIGWAWGKEQIPVLGICPALLTTQLVLLCSPRDTAGQSLVGGIWFGDVSFIDFTRSAARSWYKDQLKTFLS
ncbi:MAG: hypothetical protein AAB242_02775, partial [Nitrospirota bacterium]